MRKYGGVIAEINLPKGWSCLRGLVSRSNVVILNLFFSLKLRGKFPTKLEGRDDSNSEKP